MSPSRPLQNYLPLKPQWEQGRGAQIDRAGVCPLDQQTHAGLMEEQGWCQAERRTEQSGWWAQQARDPVLEEP